MGNQAGIGQEDCGGRWCWSLVGAVIGENMIPRIKSLDAMLVGA